MISNNTSISSFGIKKSLMKEKDYELLHYFDDQSDDDSDQEKSKSKSKSKNKKKINEKDSMSSNNLYTSSDDDSKEENFFECDKDSEYDLNEKVIDKSPDGNYGKVHNNFFYIKYFNYSMTKLFIYPLIKQYIKDMILMPEEK